MPSTLLRLAVALLAFGLGVTATTLWIAYRTPEVKFQKSKTVKKRECKVGPILPLSDELPPPPLDVPPLPTIEAPPPPPHAPVVGGVLNGKAISKPQPVYPPVAVAARAAGVVNVQVTVDENGDVIFAHALSGHPLLQQAAVKAAYGARFAPTRLSGQPVKVAGVLSYNFVLP